jgi:hypothetical protein
MLMVLANIFLPIAVWVLFDLCDRRSAGWVLAQATQGTVGD